MKRYEVHKSPYEFHLNHEGSKITSFPRKEGEQAHLNLDLREMFNF